MRKLDFMVIVAQWIMQGLVYQLNEDYEFVFLSDLEDELNELFNGEYFDIDNYWVEYQVKEGDVFRFYYEDPSEV